MPPVKSALQALRELVLSGRSAEKAADVGTTYYRGIPRAAENNLESVSGLHAKERKSFGIAPGTQANTRGFAWSSDNPLVAETYSHRGGVMVPMTLNEAPGAVFDARGLPWYEWFYPGQRNVARPEYEDALRDPKIRSVLVKNVMDPGGGVTSESFLRRIFEMERGEPPQPGRAGFEQLQGLDPDKYLMGNNILIKDPSVMRYKITGKKPEFKQGGAVRSPLNYVKECSCHG